MGKTYSNILFIFIIFFSTGCSSFKYYRDIPNPVKADKHSIALVVGVEQEGIYARIDRSEFSAVGAVVGGIGGAIAVGIVDATVNNIRRKKAALIVKPVRDALLDYSLENKLISKFSKEFNQIQWLDKKFVAVEKKTIETAYAKHYYKSGTNLIAFISLDYSFSANFNTLIVSAEVGVYPRTDELALLRNSFFNRKPAFEGLRIIQDVSGRVFSNKIAIRTKIPGSTKSYLVKSWSDNKGEKIKKALDDAIFVMAKSLAHDLKFGTEKHSEKNWKKDGFPMAIKVIGRNKNAIVNKNEFGEMIGEIFR